SLKSWVKTLRLPIRFSVRLSNRSQYSSIHIDDLSIDKVAGLTRQKYSHPIQIPWISPSSCRCAINDKLVEGMAIYPQRGGLVCGKIAGTYTVDLYIELGPFGGQVAGQHFQSTFGSRIGCNIIPAQFAHHGAYVDDLSRSLGFHCLGDSLRENKWRNKVHIYHL